MSTNNSFSIAPTQLEDWDDMLNLFSQAMDYQDENYKVWTTLDKNSLKKDIQAGLQYKITRQNKIAGVFSIQHSDPLIWTKREKNDALYLHRMVTHIDFKGQRLFQKILDWSLAYTRKKNLRFLRMDTWAENRQLIAYYKTYGFKQIGLYTTGDDPELPIQNRSLTVALLELKI